jgi:ATP-dependent Clp protease ATP-binding subunit ClpA
MLWKNGETELDVSKYNAHVALLIENTIEHCAENSHSQISLLSLLYPVFAHRESGGIDTAVEKHLMRLMKITRNFLKNGMSMDLCAKTIEASAKKTKNEFNPYERSYWSEEAALIAETADADWDLNKYVFRILEILSDSDASGFEMLQEIFDINGLAYALSNQAGTIKVFNDNGELIDGSLSLGARQIVQNARKLAQKQGKSEVLLSHILCAVLDDKDGYAANILNRLPAYNLSGAKSRAVLTVHLWNDFDAESMPQTMKESTFHQQVVAFLENAAELTNTHGEKVIDERRLFLQLLCDSDAGLQMVLNSQLKWPVQEIISAAEKTKWNPLATMMPVSLCECRNLSLEGNKSWLVARNDITDQVIEILYNPMNHNAALFGESGVGKTTIAYLLADALKSSSAALLQETPVIYLNLENVTDGNSGGNPVMSSRNVPNSVVTQIFTFMEEHPRSIYVLDGISGEIDEFIGICAKRLAANSYKSVLILDNALKKVFDDYQAGIVNLQYIEIEELSAKTSEKSELIEQIISSQIPRICEAYDVEFEQSAADYALRISNDYLLSKRFPQKSIALLESVAAVMRTRVNLRGGDKPVIGRRQLAESIAQETGLPIETILGTGQDKDFDYLLSKGLVGQSLAVSKVADRLDLIQKGMVDTKRPAAIFLFAGLSGTGKTELAKQIASVYSSSHKITTYEMNGFKESHATSRIIGVPPGYVGYEEGGKLINDINRDPYSLILFDEVEKAHPAMWDPLMRLFDEGIVEDTRGVTAYGNKAFFVLTSNIGQYEIVQMLRENYKLEDIEKVIEDAIGEAVHRESKEKCFRPEFIGRIKRSGGIVIFNSLSLEALEGITRRIALTEETKFEAMRECKLKIDDEVIRFIAQKQFEENEEVIRRKSKYFGARPLNPLFDELVMNKLAKNIKSFANARMIRVVMDGGTTALLPVTGEDELNGILQRNREVVVERVIGRLDRLSMFEPQTIAALSDDKLSRLDAILAEAGIMSGV